MNVVTTNIEKLSGEIETGRIVILSTRPSKSADKPVALKK